MKKSFVIGFAAGLVVAGTSLVLANSQIQAILNEQIKITLNGITQTFRDETTNEIQYPITYHDRTYLPVRTVANLVGVDVDYDKNTNTAILTSKKENGQSTIKQEDEVANMVNKPPYYYYDSECGNGYYFIYKDEIYFYNNKYNWSSGTTTHTLYRMNLDGTNKRVFKESDELYKPRFYFVYRDEAYFHLGDGAQHNPETGKIVNKKINLKTGEISNVNCDEFLLPNTLKDGKVKTYYNVRDLKTIYVSAEMYIGNCETK